jgi:hypothetical protein
MKTFFLLATLLIIFTAFCSAQTKLLPAPPPPAAPDYNPDFWKEYSFPEDNVRFKFPVMPKPTETTIGTTAKLPARVYERQSFMLFQLIVAAKPAEENQEGLGKSADLIRGVHDTALSIVKSKEPKIIKDEDITVDGHPGKFLQF